jgi:hypothetical protein
MKECARAALDSMLREEFGSSSLRIRCVLLESGRRLPGARRAR